jgi:hypothetical protein
MAEHDGAAPPEGGRMDHDAMRRAAELPVTGPAASDTLAAGGGLDLPGRALEGGTPDQQSDRADADRLPPPTLTSVEKLENE